MSDVTIFAPSPTLTVTVEDHPQGSEIHVHAAFYTTPPSPPS